MNTRLGRVWVTLVLRMVLAQESRGTSWLKFASPSGSTSLNAGDFSWLLSGLKKPSQNEKTNAGKRNLSAQSREPPRKQWLNYVYRSLEACNHRSRRASTIIAFHGKMTECVRLSFLTTLHCEHSRNSVFNTRNYTVVEFCFMQWMTFSSKSL